MTDHDLRLVLYVLIGVMIGWTIGILSFLVAAELM